MVARGEIRRLDKSIEYLNFADANLEKSVDLRLPWASTENQVFSESGNYVAGVSGMGKPSFSFNSIALNMGRFPFFTLTVRWGRKHSDEAVLIFRSRLPIGPKI